MEWPDSTRDHFGSSCKTEKKIKFVHGSGAVVTVHSSAWASVRKLRIAMSGVQAQYAAQEAALAAQMQADVDTHANAQGAPGGPYLPPPGMQQQVPMPDPAVMMQALMQQIMQKMMDYMQQALPQTRPGAALG